GTGVLYQLKDLAGAVWEECLIDISIDEGDETYVVASEIYEVRSEVCNGECFIVIQDKNGRLFCKLRRTSAESAEIGVLEIQRIAAKRSRIVFEMRFGFEGETLPIF